MKFLSIIIFLLWPFLFLSQEDSVHKLVIKSPCPCKTPCADTVQGPCTINVDLQFKNLSAKDFDCFGFKLLRDNCTVACIRNTDSIPWNFIFVVPGQYTIEFFADGYYFHNHSFVIRKSDVSTTDHFLISKKQLPKYLQELILQRRKKH